jgi:hypothetical protein
LCTLNPGLLCRDAQFPFVQPQKHIVACLDSERVAQASRNNESAVAIQFCPVLLSHGNNRLPCQYGAIWHACAIGDKSG